MPAPNLVGELWLVNRIVETCDADVSRRRINAFLIHQLNAVELKHLLEPLDSRGVARQAVEMLDDDHVEVLLSHTFEQTLIAISLVFGKARLCSVDKFTNDIEAIACGDLPAE